MRVIFALVKSVAADIIPFSVFLMLSMALIATTNYHLNMHSHKNNDGFYDTIEGRPLGLCMRDMYLLAFGEFNLDDLNFAEWCMFFLSTILIQIMMLNLLIAILSETFARVTGEIEESDMIEINNLILDATCLQFWNRNEYQSTYLHWVEYKWAIAADNSGSETLAAIIE